MINFFTQQPPFSFAYGGIPFTELNPVISKAEEDSVYTTTYRFSDGLVVTNQLTVYKNACEWVNYFENTSPHPTEMISDLWDGCISLPLPYEQTPGWTSRQPEFEEATTVYAPTGSTWSFDEFHCYPDRKADNCYIGHLPPGSKRTFSTSGGRSSEQQAPFFNIHKDDTGYILAIGWSGQWNCSMSRSEYYIDIKTQIADTAFRLLPKERFRTSSVVLMSYTGTVTDSHNQWRRLIKQHFTPIALKDHAPLCAGFWGGMHTDHVLDRIAAIHKYQLPIEYIWMDAGWYGIDTKPTPDEFEGDWPEHTGDWRVSPLIHPNGLKDVSKAAHDVGRKFLLWFEPERVRRSTPIAEKHPEYFLFPEDPNTQDLLLNLGNEEAFRYCYQTISDMIQEIGIDCYRQDFNMSPLTYWRRNDTPDRQGMTEILHINGLYRLWDQLLIRFPGLLIDNCASGGRRIDIETLRRSIPLWRSDYQCPDNHPEEGTQSHCQSFPKWMPFSGTGGGNAYDVYRFRSGYSPAFTTNYTFNLRKEFGTDPDKMQWLKTQLEEYLCLRPYLTEDFYPLTEISDRKDTWCGMQFHRPQQEDGAILVFRREHSPYETACFPLGGIQEDHIYCITDTDTNGQITCSGQQLQTEGLSITLTQKRSSKILYYQVLE